MPSTTATVVLIVIFVLAGALIALPRVLARREERRGGDPIDRGA
jgi:hypothetical protein